MNFSEETFENVTAPVFLGYYYKDENNQDEVIKVSAELKMFKQLGTLPSQKTKVAFADAGDHVIACELTSGCYDEVIATSYRFSKISWDKEKIQNLNQYNSGEMTLLPDFD